MMNLVVFDSQYGNTEIIATAIAKAIGGTAVRAGEFKPELLNGLSLLIVGSPTYGGRPTPAIAGALAKIPAAGLANIKVAAFDTRFFASEQGIGLRLILKVFAYVAPRLAENLVNKGGQLVAPGMGFFVKGKEGPLKEGELERAVDWAKQLSARI